MLIIVVRTGLLDYVVRREPTERDLGFIRLNLELYHSNMYAAQNVHRMGFDATVNNFCHQFSSQFTA